MDNVEFEAEPEGGLDGYFPVLYTYARSGAVRKLSGLAELSFVGGRAGDCSGDWEQDIEAALGEMPGLKGDRRGRVMERIKDAFYRGCEAHLPFAANPPAMARDFANGLALAAAQRLKRAPAGEVDEAIAVAAEQVARDLPVSIPNAARATLDAFAGHGLNGTDNAECVAVAAARDGWRLRGGFAAELREIEAEVFAADFASGEEALAAHAAALVERHRDSVEMAVETALIAAERHGFDVEPEHSDVAREAAKAAWKRWRDECDSADVAPYPANAAPPAWWVDYCEGGNPDRFELDREPGLLGDLARWSVQYAFRPVPEFAPLVALATLAPVFSRRFATPTNAGLNLYLIGLAETGGGKEAVIGAPQALLAAAKLDFLIGAGDFTSDSAIELALRNRPNFLACIDEVSEFIGAAQHRNAAAHSRTLRKAMLELYSKARPDARWSGKQKVEVDHADKAASPIYSPHLSLLGCATVAGFFEALTEGNLTGGFVNRWVVVGGGKPGAFNADPGRMSVPEALRTALTAAYADTAAGGNLSDGAARDPYRQPHMRIVPWGEGGEEAWRSVLLIQAEAVDAGRGDLVGRAAENCLKVATIRALARDGLAAAVTAQDVLWAWEIVRTSIETVEAGARENMAGSDFEMLVKTIEKAVVEAGPEGMAMSKLLERRGVAKHTKSMVDAALERLEARGVIYKPAIATGLKGGRPGMRVRGTQYDRE